MGALIYIIPVIVALIGLSLTIIGVILGGRQQRQKRKALEQQIVLNEGVRRITIQTSLDQWSRLINAFQLQQLESPKLEQLTAAIQSAQSNYYKAFGTSAKGVSLTSVYLRLLTKPSVSLALVKAYQEVEQIDPIILRHLEEFGKITQNIDPDTLKRGLENLNQIAQETDKDPEEALETQPQTKNESVMSGMSGQRQQGHDEPSEPNSRI